jgi:hypothetical protein
MYWNGILGRPPVTPEDWAHVILAGDASLGCAAPVEVYDPKHKELIEIVRAIQEQAATKARTLPGQTST